MTTIKKIKAKKPSAIREKVRCSWCLKDELYKKYHDEEWGIPVHDDEKLFEMICLEGAQAGLSWHTILNKRENYRKAFDGFNPVKMSRYGAEKIERLMNNAGIVRNRLKINAFISNAKAYLAVKNEFGSFSKYIWQFTNGRPIVNARKKLSDIPARTELSDRISKDLLARGFKFVGSTICYAFMQAVGIVDDHTIDCWKKTTSRKRQSAKAI